MFQHDLKLPLPAEFPKFRIIDEMGQDLASPLPEKLFRLRAVRLANLLLK